MAKLNGEQIAVLRSAILDAFTKLEDLDAMLEIRLDRTLSHISLAPTLPLIVLDVIRDAESKGWTDDLLDAVAAERPGVAKLQEVCTQLRAVVESPEPQDTTETARREAASEMGSDSDADLKRHLASGEVDAFVGAGMSVGAGLPDWYTLVFELAERIGAEMPPRQYANAETLINLAQTYVNRQGLHSLISHLKDRLDTTGVQPTAAHRALAQLPISLVFTANYDDLLERACRDAGKRVELVVRDSGIPFMRRAPNTVNIVKLYGDLDQPDTIVLARQQYERYFLERPQLVKLLETELGRATMLYLGWSHSDPHFGLVFGQLLGQYKDFMRPGYAAMFDVPDAQRQELERKHIRLVEFPPGGDRTAQLAAWLEAIGSTP